MRLEKSFQQIFLVTLPPGECVCTYFLLSRKLSEVQASFQAQTYHVGSGTAMTRALWRKPHFGISNNDK